MKSRIIIDQERRERNIEQVYFYSRIAALLLLAFFISIAARAGDDPGHSETFNRYLINFVGNHTVEFGD